MASSGSKTTLSPAQLTQLTALAARPDSEIDTSDAPALGPEVWRNAVRGRFYRPRPAPHAEIIAGELARITLIMNTLGPDEARDFMRRTYRIYRSAVFAPPRDPAKPHFASTREWRPKFLAVCALYRVLLSY